jgi:hypothetical protein
MLLQIDIAASKILMPPGRMFGKVKRFFIKLG